MRLIIDCRPGNTGFLKPEYESTSGEDLARLLVEEGYDLEAAKLDLRDFFHTCGCPAALHGEFGLSPVSAADLRAEGVDVAAEDIDDQGFCHPQLTTLPMGWIASPALAQGAHESVLYGSRGAGSEKARTLSAVVDPLSRWSSKRVPELGTDAARAPHALIVDDLLLFRQVPQEDVDSGDASGLGTAGYAAPSPYRTAAGLGPASFAAPSPNNDAAGPGTAGKTAPSPDRTAAGLGPAGFAAPSPNIGAAGLGTAGDAAPSPDRTAAGLGLAGYAAPAPNLGPASCPPAAPPPASRAWSGPPPPQYVPYRCAASCAANCAKSAAACAASCAASCAAKRSPSPARGSSPGAPSPSAERVDGLVERLRAHFGLSDPHAALLRLAANGSPDSAERAQPPRAERRVRGVYPLPFLGAERSTPLQALRAGVRRRVADRRRRVSKTTLSIALLNLLYGGVDCLEAALDAHPGAAQLSALARVCRTVRDWDFSADAAAAEELAGQPIVGYSLGEELCAAVDTVPELVKLPGTVGRAHLLDLLPPRWAEVYASEEAVVKGGIHAEAADYLRPRAFMSPPLRNAETLHALVARMWDAGMLVVLGAVKERVGLFTVARPDGLQRLVVDPRPTNAAWGDPPPVQLAAGALLARQLQRSRSLSPSSARSRMSKSDLSDFYYNMRVPAWMAPWFAIPEVPGAVIGRPDLPSVNLGFGVLPMGASHAVFLAQEAHVELLRRAGLPMDRRLADGAALLDAGAFFVVQIDDLVLCAATEEEARDTARWLDLALRAYEAAGLPVSERKVERVASTALGMEIDSAARFAGAKVAKRQRVARALLAVAQWRAAPSRLMESLVGHATFAFMFQRVGLAAFGAVFAHIRAGEDAGKPLAPRALAPRCRWELITAALILAFAKVDLGAPTASLVLASDASPWGFAVCSATVPSTLAADALRFAELRGEYVALDGSAARRPAQSDRVAPQRPLAAGWEGVQWRGCFARPWRSGSSVQAIGELRAAEYAFEYAARKLDVHGSVQLALLDARSALAAIAKGRSSAWSFLCVLRRIAALALATGIQWCPRWVSSEEQPADAGSRLFAPRAPVVHREFDSTLGFPGEGPPRPLRGGKLKRDTMIRYLKAFLSFYAWCVDVGWVTQVRDLPGFEAALIDWMEDQHMLELGPHKGDCVFGAIKLLSKRTFDSLVDARALLSDWHGLNHATHWPPIPYPLVFALAEDQLLRGRVDLALAFLVAFSGLLRIGEVSGLRVADVVLPEDARFWGVRYVVLALKHTKTGDDASAELRDAWLWPLLRVWCRTRSVGGPSARLFPSPPELRAGLAESAAALGIVAAGFVFHSFRAGGALRLLNADTPLPEVLRRGRWRRPESARPYLQRLRALCAAAAIPAPVLARGALWAVDPSALLAAWCV